MNDAGALLATLGFPGAVSGGAGTLAGKIRWNGSPLRLDYRSLGGEGRPRGLLLPWFLIAFVVFAGANSAAIVPKAAVEYLNHASRWCLVIAIAALGMKTSLAALGRLGWRPVALMTAETIFLAALAVAALL